MTFLQVANSILVLTKQLMIRGDVKVTIEVQDPVERDKIIRQLTEHLSGHWPGVKTPQAISQMIACQPFNLYGITYKLDVKPERRTTVLRDG